MPDKLGWFLMESPSLFGFWAIYLSGAHRASPGALALLGLWTLHYAQRTLVYPLRTKSQGKRMPLVILLSAVAFNCLNASVNATRLSVFGDYPREWLTDPRFLLGALVFVAGFALNLDADRRLFALRAPGETGYKIPRGGLYEWVSCPNYLSEIVEWLGFALASWSLEGLAFALYTIANLAPRAKDHHAWYREKFPEYPPRRKALVPFVW